MVKKSDLSDDAELRATTDVDWLRDGMPHTLAVDGYDGNGWKNVCLPMDDATLSEFRAMVEAYCEAYAAKTRKPTAEEAKALANWQALNTYLRNCGTSEKVRMLLAWEHAGARRLQYLRRIHNTFNKLRGREERAEIERVGMRSR